MVNAIKTPVAAQNLNKRLSLSFFCNDSFKLKALPTLLAWSVENIFKVLSS
jgi:hypothetical protein